MRRRLSYFISALALAGLAAAALRTLDLPSQTGAVPKLEVPAVISKIFPSPAPSSPDAESDSTHYGHPSAPGGLEWRRDSSAREVVVRAVRNGKDYGWIQLPRGTRVDFVRADKHGYIVRYDEVTLRVTREQVEAGMVVPVQSGRAAIASL